ncbi:PTS sugar transporter subunit IIA [Vagococcus coleopterorum]|uniref:Ascorbate-specific PTS system EIIA component n=1 Tax=Vagococcus coleopterorum TaxID=2714946 RepID=A0A6G8APH4_9ENTE|nr:PTS sugar transporter subunit IIA [Vagococcus coleopterorum]QIL46823.1 PTS sugar transporter subunit IIA [Vagococcus coleopterorum]
MLQSFLEKDLVRFESLSENTWQNAIKVSCQSLEDQGIVDSEYADELIGCVNEFGPYIVIIPGVAMPHSSQGSNHINGTAINLTIFDQEVVFDEEKKAKVFFTLAAQNPEEHMENISSLSELLMEDGLVDELQKLTNIDEYQALITNY